MSARAPEVRLWVDSFAGGGGASKGMELARGLGPDVAINHDAEAIALHAANHPETQHYNEDVWKVDPLTATKGQRVELMWLSPDCKHFSKAKGGKPVSKRVRGLAWVAVRWAAAVKPDVIVLENVEEFQGWGPVLASGKPCPQRKGKTFRAFKRRLERLGYVVEHRELRACDYGAPTIRKRLFLVARCDGQAIVWPRPTHGKHSALPWRTAAECIDFSHDCPSIFARKKPLAENTLKRIAAGLRRFVFEAERPFIVEVQNATWGGKPIDINQPMRTITAHPKGGGHALVTPSLVQYYGAKRNGDDRTADLSDPLFTQTTENRFGLVEPFLVPLTHHGSAERVDSLAEPMKTITGAHRGEVALIAPHVTIFHGGSVGVSGDAPMPTVTANSFIKRPGGSAPLGLVSAFLAKHYSERSANEVQGASLFGQAPTVTTIDHTALVTAHVELMHGTSTGRDIAEPMPAVLAQGTHLAEVRAFLVAYFGNERDGGSLFDPVRTVTSRDRFGLVTVAGVDYQLADIGMRMLQPRELYRAQGFPDSYKIDISYTNPVTGRTAPLSKTAQVRMCGNSVCPDVAAAIIRANVPSVQAAAVAA